MSTIIALALALVSPVVAHIHSCTDYCRNIYRDQEVKWHPDCICSLPEKQNMQLNLKVHQRPSTQANIFYDPSGIYYVPAKSDAVTYFDGSFYQMNPTSSIFTIYNSIAEKLDQPYARRMVANEIRGVYAHASRRKRRFNHIIAANLPIYLDIDLDKPGSQGRFSEYVLKNTFKDMRLTENDLSECLDLHTVAHLRKYGDNNLKIQNTQITEQYKNFSTPDIMANIKEKCDSAANIMQESLLEIKADFPKVDSSIIKIKNPGHSLKENNNLFLPRIKDTNTKRTIFGVVTEKPDGKSLEAATSTSSVEDISEEYFAKNIKTPHFDQASSNSTDTGVTGNVHILETPISTLALDTFSNTMVNRSANNILTVSKSSTAIFKSNNDTAVEHDNTDLNRNIKYSDGLELLIKNKLSSVLYHTNNEEFKALTKSNFVKSATNAINTSQFATSNFTLNTPGANITINDYTTGTNTPVTEKKNANRSLFIEGGYPIPKIVTKEFPNDTIISIIEGDETMRDSDFVHDNIAVSSNIKDDIKNSECVEYINCSTKLIPYIGNAREIQSESAIEITGKLFFQFGQRHVPARFVQKSDEKIHVALDGFFMCKQGQKSLIITAICNNRIQSRKCPHSLPESD